MYIYIFIYIGRAHLGPSGKQVGSSNLDDLGGEGPYQASLSEQYASCIMHSVMLSGDTSET